MERSGAAVKIFIILLYFSAALVIEASPLVIRTGLAKDTKQIEEDRNNYLHGRKQEAISVGQIEDGFDVNDERKYNAAQDSGKFNAEKADDSRNHDEGSFVDESFRHLNADSIANIAKNVGHHKGHRKSGFHNTYHKEESGNNSSYYDDSIDDGDEYVHDRKKHVLGDVENRKKYGGYDEGGHRSQENSRKGDYDRRTSLARGNGNSASFNRGKYKHYDDRLEGGLGTAGYDYYDGRKYSGYEEHQPKRTITIYEDPRILTPGYYDNRYYKRYNGYYDGNNDRVNLDFRIRPTSRHQYYNYRRPSYDYDYYYYN